MKNKREVLKTPIKILLVSGLVIVLLGLGAFSLARVGALQDSNGEITLDQAVDIALKDAGFAKEGVSFLKSKPDSDDMISKYDIEFLAGGIEYDYEIDAMTGTVIEKDVDRYYD